MTKYFKQIRKAVSEGKLKDLIFKSNWSDIFISLLPIIIIIGVWIFIMRKCQAVALRRRTRFNIGKSKAKLLMKKQM
jgi:cell division protease FtsH